MAKTNPIGVRFDDGLLTSLKEDGVANSPQKVLNFLTEFYRKNKERTFDFEKMFAESKLFKTNGEPESVTVTVKPDTHFKFNEPTGVIANQNASATDRGYFDSPPEPPKKTQEDYYYDDLAAAKTPQECEAISKAAKTDPQLSGKGRERVIEASIQRSRQDDMN